MLAAMLKLAFQGGGPLDGERLVSEHAAAARFTAGLGGWYELAQIVADEDAEDWPTAVYEWVLGSDVVSRLAARLGG